MASSVLVWIHIYYLATLSEGSIFWRTDNGLPDYQQPAVHSEFYRHQLFTPQIYIQDKPADSTKTKIGYVEDLVVIIKAFNTTFTLDLTRNRMLLGHNFTVKYFAGSQPKFYDHAHKTSHCFYHGTLRSDDSAVVSLSTCDGFRGMISTSHETYYIEPSAGRTLTDNHYILQHSDMKHKNLTCGEYKGYDSEYIPHLKQVKQLQHTNQHKHPSRLKRSVQWPYDSNEKTAIVELYIANDHTQFVNYEQNINTVIQRTLDIVNVINGLYRQLNIYVALVSMEIWTDEDQIHIDRDADRTMQNFIKYRKDTISRAHNNDNAQLISGSTFNNNVVGKAIKGTMCSLQYSAGVNMDHSAVLGSVATTIAHEMGHNFGMHHDDYTCDCPEDRCIMAASSGKENPTHWSSCSKQQLGNSFHQGLDYCLHDVPEELYKPDCAHNGVPQGDACSPVCGNGFKEEGEECDCGSPELCSSSCCNATTCKLTQNATCATGACCNMKTCQLSPAATMCRRSSGQCDLTEWCDGKTEICPSDVYKQNGETCSQINTQSYCYNGSCQTHTTQCQRLWGGTASKAADWCYQRYNIRGTSMGNCGYNRWNDTMTPCAQENVMCGTLQCRHENERLSFWRLLTFYIHNATDCQSVILDVGPRLADPGMVADGTPCGTDRLCMNHRCQPVSELKLLKCPNCHGNGICNSLGQCHCDQGHAPPYCNEPGYGGSLHSGPASSDQPSGQLLVAMCVLFLLVIPLLVVCAAIAYRYRKQLKYLCRSHHHSFFSRFNKPSMFKSTSVTRAASFNRQTSNPPPVCTTNRIYKKNNVYKHEISLPVLQDSTNEQPTHTLQKYKTKPRSNKNHLPPERPRHKPKPKAPARPPPPKVQSDANNISYSELSPEHLPLQQSDGEVQYIPNDRQYANGSCVPDGSSSYRNSYNSGGSFESVPLHSYDECQPSSNTELPSNDVYMNDAKDCDYYDEVGEQSSPEHNYVNTRAVIGGESEGVSPPSVPQRPPSLVVRPPARRSKSDRPPSGVKPSIARKPSLNR